MVSTRKKDYGEPPPPKKRVLTKVTEDDDPKKSNHANQFSRMKFTLFQKLPPELRFTIWEMSMTPRLVVVEPNGTLPGYRSRATLHKKILPAQFCVNREAREFALRHYTLRFTITVTVDITGRHNWDSPNFRSARYHANAIMSPDDTLGLLGWEILPRGFGWKFHVESADASGPWGGDSSWGNASRCGLQPQVNNVAFLRNSLRRSFEAIDILNSTVYWRLTFVLHSKTDRVKRFRTYGPPEYTTQHPGYYTDQVLIHSRNFNGTLQEWGERLSYRIRQFGLAYWQGAPDILAFELGKQPIPLPKPPKLVSDDSMGAEHRYFRHERRWVRPHPHPSSRGF